MLCAVLAMSATSIIAPLHRKNMFCIRNSAHFVLAATTARRISPALPVRWINRTVSNLPVPSTDSSNNHGTAFASGAICLATALPFTQLPSLSCHVGPAKCRPITDPSWFKNWIGAINAQRPIETAVNLIFTSNGLYLLCFPPYQLSSDCKNYPAEGGTFNEITQSLSRFGQRKRLSHNWFDRTVFK